jgi:hypothetical protein
VTLDEIQQRGVIFGQGFDVITDIQVSSYDGNMYILGWLLYGISSSS